MIPLKKSYFELLTWEVRVIIIKNLFSCAHVLLFFDPKEVLCSISRASLFGVRGYISSTFWAKISKKCIGLTRILPLLGRTRTRSPYQDIWYAFFLHFRFFLRGSHQIPSSVSSVQQRLAKVSVPFSLQKILEYPFDVLEYPHFLFSKVYCFTYYPK